MTTANRAVSWLARCSVVVSVLLALVLYLAYHVAPARSWWAELLRYLPFLSYLLPALLALALSLLLGWRWRLAAALSVGVLMTGVMDVSLGLHAATPPVQGAAAAGAAPTRTVRFMTYNIKSYRAAWRYDGFEDIAHEIAQHQPDILVMQDASMIAHRKGRLPESMQAVLSGHQLYWHGQYAVLSRFPLQGCAPADMSFPGETHEYIRCTVRIDAQDVDLVVAHLLTPREGLNATRHEWWQGIDDWQANFADRLTQSSRITEALAPLRRPTIVAGDLNAPEHSLVVGNLLGLGLRDAFSAGGRGWGYTHGHMLKPGLSFLRIDHILVSPELGVSRAWVGWRGASEHRPVVADLVVPTGPASR